MNIITIQLDVEKHLHIESCIIYFRNSHLRLILKRMVLRDMGVKVLEMNASTYHKSFPPNLRVPPGHYSGGSIKEEGPRGSTASRTSSNQMTMCLETGKWYPIFELPN